MIEIYEQMKQYKYSLNSISNPLSVIYVGKSDLDAEAIAIHV